MKIKTNQFPSLDQDWIDRMGDIEDQNGPIGVGGIAVRLEKSKAPMGPSVSVFGQFVELYRRRNGLSVEQLAEQARIALEELVAIERCADSQPSPRTVYQIADYFKLPQDRLMQVAGITTRKSGGLQKAAVLFAARSEPTARLTPQEDELLNEFVKVLVESTD
ncbi:hypothetical protein Pla108_13400 [Botrimarina colliarenosi]|uniref:HTH cro/C1-type domain-containing protein n=1 Tax=Botrimarina colliarenosi TaxID=2528001 RepID=A0A5C6AL55_9BACT|nr:helix-turn-helix transcriptional regulator [Botrimarina colliarenosi]TWU00390.1 hypothetical protein Pla108_13400 [Botrimarina colliarenosi]